MLLYWFYRSTTNIHGSIKQLKNTSQQLNVSGYHFTNNFQQCFDLECFYLNVCNFVRSVAYILSFVKKLSFDPVRAQHKFNPKGRGREKPLQQLLKYSRPCIKWGIAEWPLNADWPLNTASTGKSIIKNDKKTPSYAIIDNSMYKNVYFGKKNGLKVTWMIFLSFIWVVSH